jgi:tetratricopeptide (TPR) repeat protein
MPAEQVVERVEAENEVVKQLGRSPIFGWWALGLLHTQRGEPAAEGLAFFELAETACSDAELWNQLALTSFFRAWLYELVDDWARAERELRSSYEQFDAIADRGMLPLISGLQARVLTKTGKMDEAEERARWAAQSSEADDFHQQVAWRRGLALVEAQLGQYDEARRVAAEAVDLTRQSDWLNLHAETLEDLAEVAVASGNSEDTCSALDEAIDVHERKGNRVALERAEDARSGGSTGRRAGQPPGSTCGPRRPTGRRATPLSS